MADCLLSQGLKRDKGERGEGRTLYEGKFVQKSRRHKNCFFLLNENLKKSTTAFG